MLKYARGRFFEAIHMTDRQRDLEPQPEVRFIQDRLARLTRLNGEAPVAPLRQAMKECMAGVLQEGEIRADLRPDDEAFHRIFVEMRALTAMFIDILWRFFLNPELTPLAELSVARMRSDFMQVRGLSIENAVFVSEYFLFRDLSRIAFSPEALTDPREIAAYQRFRCLLGAYDYREDPDPPQIVAAGFENGLGVIIGLVDMIQPIYQRDFGGAIPSDLHLQVLTPEGLWPLLGVWSSMSAAAVGVLERTVSNNFTVRSPISLGRGTHRNGFDPQYFELLRGANGQLVLVPTVDLLNRLERAVIRDVVPRSKCPGRAARGASGGTSMLREYTERILQFFREKIESENEGGKR